MRDELLADGMISPDDVDLLHVTDDPDEAVEVVVDCYERRCAETPGPPLIVAAASSSPRRSARRRPSSRPRAARACACTSCCSGVPDQRARPAPSHWTIGVTPGPITVTR